MYVNLQGQQLNIKFHFNYIGLHQLFHCIYLFIILKYLSKPSQQRVQYVLIILLYMNYNDFTYHRANPYAKQGYMPPRAHINRHQPQFLTQIPMGENHFDKIGKRQFAHALYHSNIQQQNILKSPQRYPYQNRIALQKNYQRNLKTIDIEGASSSTLKSQAVRNKLRAREQLIRRQKQGSSSNFAHLQHLESTQQQRRRQIAHQQYIRNQHIKQLNAGKLVRPQGFQQMYQSRANSQSNQPSVQQQKSSRQQPNISHTRNSIPQIKSNTPQKYKSQDKIKFSPRYQSIQIPRITQNPQSDSITQLLKPRQQMNPTNYQQYPYQSPKNSNNNNTISHNTLQNQLNKSMLLKNSYIDNKNTNTYIKSNQIQNGLGNSLKIDRKLLRQLNPTVLTSQNSMYLAGRNIIEY